MSNETFRTKLKQAKFFAAALLLVTLTLLISFGTPVNAACTVRFLNATNLTVYWGQNITVGINVTDTTGNYLPALGSIFKLDLVCANTTLCGTQVPNQNQTGDGPQAGIVAATGDTGGGFASLTLPATQNPLYTSAAVGSGGTGAPLFPGNYYTAINFVSGAGCGSGANVTEMGVNIKGYSPLFTVTNIVNGTTPTLPGRTGSIVNVSLLYPNDTAQRYSNYARYRMNLTRFNFTIGTVAINQSAAITAYNATGNSSLTAWAFDNNFTLMPNTIATVMLNASWTRDRVYVNVTAVSEDGWYVSYANTTINYINIQLNKSDGTAFTGNAFLWKLNGTTKIPMIPAGWGLNHAQAPPFIPLTAGTFTINCYDPESRCYDASRPTGMYSVSGSILGPTGETSGVMASELENAAVQIVAYDMASSNMTDTWTITPYGNAKAINLTLNNSGSMSQFSVRTLSQSQGVATLSSMRIYDGSGMAYNINTTRTDEFERSVPLKLGTNYSIEVAGTEESLQPFTMHNITYTPVFNGFGGALILVWNSTVSSYTLVKGQVISQVPGTRNITVYAEPRECHGGGPFVSTCIVNSTLTDANGIFQMRVPIIPGMNEYKFTAADARRNDGGGKPYSGALIHYPTKDDNNGRYYQAQGALLVAPPINMTYAGTMSLSVNITPDVFGVMTELSRLRLLASGWVRDNFVNRMAMANVFGFMTTAAPITSVTFPMDSPTNGSSTVNLFFWGMGVSSGRPGPDNQPNIIMGGRNVTTAVWRTFTSVTSNTTTQGNLVLRVSMCNGGSVFSQTGACSPPAAMNPMQGGGSYWNFWWNSKVLIYHAGNSTQPYQYLDGTEDSLFLSQGKIPLMPGLYQLVIESKYDWNKPLSQNRTIPFQINAGANTNLTAYVFSPGWDIRSQTFPYTMRRTAANILNVSVFDLAQPSGLPLTQTSKLNMSFQAVNVNGTPAMAAINMTWANITPMGGGNPFESFLVNFTPVTYGLPAGKYIGLFRANLTNYTINPFGPGSDMSGTCASADQACTAGYYADLYITNQPQQYQFIVSDFDIGTEPYKRTFAPGETIKATLYGFNNTDSNGLNGTVATYIYNDAGRLINSTPTTWTQTAMLRYNMSYGIANLSIPAPATVGWYEILSILNVTDGRGNITTDTLINTTERGQALSDMWVKVSNFGFDDKYNKKSYATSDVVKLGVTLTNGTTGTAITNAAITAFVDQDQTPIFALTDAKGRATFQLTKSGNWSYGGHNVRMAVNAFNSSGNNEVISEQFFSWFDVGGIDVNFYPTKSKYTVAENVTLNVYSASVSSSNAFTLYIDGNETQASWSQGTNYWTTTTTIAGQWLPGRHFAQLKVGSGSGSASFFAGFETAAANLIITMNKTAYVVGDGAGATVKVINATNMLPAANLLVTGKFYKQSAGSNKLIATTSNWTTPLGIVLLNATIPESGYYLLEVLAAGQKETATFRASGMSVLVQGNSTFRAGDTIQFNITSIAQSTVEPTLWAYGEKIQLPSGVTGPATSGTQGDYILNYTLPSDAPGGTYTLDVKVTTSTSVVGFNTTTFKLGSYNIQLSSGKSFMESFRQGESTLLVATVRNDTSAVAADLNVTFMMGGKTVTDTIKGTARTDASGKAVLSTTVPSSDDFYYAKAYVTDSPEVSAYAPVVVASLNVTLTTINGTTGLPTDRFVYTSVAGDVPNILYNVTVRTYAGALVNLTDGTTGGINILLFSKDGGEISQPFGSTIAPTADGRYSLNTTLPNITGSFSFVAMVRANNTMGFATSMASLSTANLIMNITTIDPATIMANQTDFNVTVNVFDQLGAGQTGTLAVTIFSPTGGGTPIYYNPSFPLGTPSSNFDGVANLNISATNITYPGIYIVKAVFTSGANKISNYTILRVSAGTRLASLDVSSITSSSATITSNVPNATAYVMRESAGRTTTLALPLVPSGSNYYTLAPGLTSGTNYFVRLDNTNSTGVNTTMFRTS